MFEKNDVIPINHAYLIKIFNSYDVALSCLQWNETFKESCNYGM